MDKIEQAAASGLCIQMIFAEDLVAALDGSGDCATRADFDDLMITKYMDLDPMLVEDLEMVGIEIPLLVDVEAGGWFFEDGHHRLAWALEGNQMVPVCFTELDTEIVDLFHLIDDDRFYDHKH